RIERAAAQNLLDYVHAIQSVDPDLQADATTCASGIAGFCGSDSPLTTVKGAGPEIQDSDLESAERFFRQRGAGQAVVELAPWISETSIQRLVQRGYRVLATEDVVIRYPPFDTSIPHHQVEPVDSAKWPALQLLTNGAPDTRLWELITKASAQ